MSRFVSTLKTDQTDRRTYKLLDDLVLADDDERTITVPAGFVTDFASIQVLHNVFLFVLFALVSGYGNYAATVHDAFTQKARSAARRQMLCCTGHCARKVSLDGEPGCSGLASG